MSEVDPYEELSPEVAEEVNGIIHLGAISTDVDFCGHTFGLRTLRAAEEVAAATAIADYRNTLKEADAWIYAQIGLALTHIDGEEDFCPKAGPDLKAFARARFNYVAGNWFHPTLEYLYSQYVLLQGKQLRILRAVQDLSTRSLSTYSPSVDSSEKPGTFKKEIDLETLPSLPSTLSS